MDNRSKKTDSIENVKSIVMRTLSGNERAEFYFKESKIPVLNGDLLSFPSSCCIDDYDISYIRGVIDSASLQLKYHNKEILRHICAGKDTEVQYVLDNAEKARCELIVMLKYDGIKANILKKIEKEFKRDSCNSVLKNSVFSQVFYLSVISANSNVDLSLEIKEFILQNVFDIQMKRVASLIDVVDDQSKFLNLVTDCPVT